jgi:DNA-binding transcriptional ArsR family regulator
MAVEYAKSRAGVGAGALDRILKALNHPVRREILRMLSEKPASASTLASELGEELGMISYHLNQVLAKECDVIELVETIPRRGALEKIYAVRTEVWSEVAGGTAGAEATCEWFPLQVDSECWSEICKARTAFHERVAAAVAEHKLRRENDREAQDVRKVLVGMAVVGP